MANTVQPLPRKRPYRAALWWATSWLRWHLPVSREQAQRYAEQYAEDYYQVLNPKLQFVLAAMERFVCAEENAKVHEESAEESSGRREIYLAWSR